MISISSQTTRLTENFEPAWANVRNHAMSGFVDLVENNDAHWQAIRERCEQVGTPKRLVIVGIGGSSLGAQVLSCSFGFHMKAQVHFLESPDPEIWRDFSTNGINWADLHVILVSKSGGTLETLAWVEFLNSVEPRWWKKAQVTVIASPGDGMLQTWATQEDLSILWLPENVGGRYSVLSAVGMLPAGLMGQDIDEFRRGANWALKNLAVAETLARDTLNAWKSGAWISQMWIYADRLRVFGEWWQQLWSESLAKAVQTNGEPGPRVSTPMSCLGPRDQHSLFQQLLDGDRDKHLFQIRVKDLEKSGDIWRGQIFPKLSLFDHDCSLGKILGVEAESFALSVREKNIPLTTLWLETVNESQIGALFMTWQLAVALLGVVIGVDPFNQPGVELGKRHARRLLSQSS